MFALVRSCARAQRFSRVQLPRYSHWSLRNFATDRATSTSVSKKLPTANPLTDGKPKPKEVTPLRRSASESLAFRTNPTPTRSPIQPVFTFATSERYILSRLRSHPDLPPRAQALHEAWWVPKWVGNNGQVGEVFVFSNGSFVSWGLDEVEVRRFAKQIIDRTAGMSVARLKEEETEELEFVVDPSELSGASTRLQGDLIILGKTPPLSEPELLPVSLPPMAFPEESLLARYAYSQALSRSTALAALEESLDNYLDSMAMLPHTLAETGKPGMPRKQLIKKLGELMKFRQLLNLNKENFSEVPDFYWAEPELEKYFKSMSNALEVRGRTAALNDKITYAGELQSSLRQLLTESSGHSMELIIILLIAVEVVIALIREGPDLWRMVRGEKEEDKLSVSA
ncbi:cytoplasmic protein [Coprinopsis cinerea okayama7|uniref:Cytoplasmic protein n=1 Tax=Coprinopsis cinerea (strain Okayama-7 / 130 / ATCC MYA-4618 / FGSC 9003) TaxID=240176 RepID=A8NUF4_COPC7|nr:cytoplasmic protein [Coprinopsis cinerea okayama7\|eukprot:XP_001836444.2 cytoplasmic protein [Coprinopsis cinerea okayama7\